MSTATFAATDWQYFFRSTDAQYTAGYYYYNSPSGHKGLDVIVPHDSTGEPTKYVGIYSPTIGTVKYAGYYGNTGYMVAFSTTNNPVTSDTPLMVRMLHMQSQLYVDAGDEISSTSILGFVGNTGKSAVAHLHIDINGVETYDGNLFTVRDCLDPEDFFPNVNFTHNGLRSSYMSCTTESFTSLDKNIYIDNALIKYVGTQAFDSWAEADCENATVENFKNHFGISDTEFRSICDSNGITSIYF